MSTFKKGDKVRQIVPVIEGFVAGFQIDQESGERLILVDYVDGDGDESSRYFQESHLELVETAAEDATEAPAGAAETVEATDAVKTTAEAASPSAEESATGAE